MSEKKHLLLIPSTHWDREWYKTQAEFEVFLTELFDRVLSRLETGELSNFFTDGQAVIVEDMLTLKPQWKERIARFAAAGKLEIGPFYALTDMYVPSGESFFRNLKYGIEIIRALGGTPGIPYAPDAFGHSADLPAILASAGFDAYFFCRGMGNQLNPPRSEFIWRDRYHNYKLLGLSAIIDIFHPVTGRWICGAYALGMNLPRKDDEFRERLEILMAKLQKYSDLPDQLAINGSDHLLPEDDLAGRVARFNASGADFVAETTTIGDFVARAWRNLDMKKLPSVSGELIAGKFFRILTGTSSSRIGLKIRNARAQYFLEKLVEPVLACAPASVRERYQEHLDKAWKMLLQNQTHDSICGCGTDAVVRENAVRFDRIESVMTAVAERLLRLACGVGELRMFMPAPDAAVIKIAVSRNADDTLGRMWHFSIVLPDAVRIDDYVLTDNDGREWDFIAEMESKACTTNGPFMPCGPSMCLCSRLRIYTDMPLPDGCCCCASAFFRKKVKKTDKNNAVIPVLLSGRELKFTAGNHAAEDFLSLCSTTDTGDEYDYRPGENPVTVYNAPWRETDRLISGTLYTVSFACDISVPACAGSAENVVLPVALRITGSFREKAFLARILVDNRAKDHRLQLVIKTPFAFSEYCRQSQMQHCITTVERLTEPDNWRDRTEPLRRNFGYMSIHREDGDFAIMPQGLHEHTTDGKGFSLTLLRAVGSLGRTKAGPAIVTPEAQEQGEHLYSVAFSWEGNGTKTNALWKQSSRLLYSACGAVLHPDLETPACCCSFFKLFSGELMISAFYYDKEAGRNIVRIFNPTSENGTGILSGSCIPEKIEKIGYIRGGITPGRETADPENLRLKPGEIASFIL
ncbi:MAG: hypothetical protein IJH79_01405 [Lentisphaeria bacterium]|nr:hypothetical protein [Lentisphaeria bacterium]